jgi:hypothetical protein
MALSGNGSRVSCGLTGRSLENRPLAASWPPMRDGLNGPMDENQLWFVETVSQSVSSRGPRRSAHHRLNGHTDGFRSPNCRIEILESGPSGHPVYTEVC